MKVKKFSLSRSGQQEGYRGSILFMDLSTGGANVTHYDDEFLRSYVGGASLGIRLVWEYVDPKTEWFAPQNCLFIGTGPLGGTLLPGSGTICVVTKGALTNGIASSQANGYFGYFLRTSGFDSILIKGAAEEWIYLYIDEGTVEIRTAEHLRNKDTWETDDIIRKELGKGVRDVSVLCIGPAGERLVRFASICIDKGHIAAHNGVGAVMGSKKLKAIAVARGRRSVPVRHKELLSEVAKKISSRIKADKWMSMTLEEGTVGGVVIAAGAGHLPVRNYTTTRHGFSEEELNAYSGQNIRSRFSWKPNPCWRCSAKHCHIFQVTEGKFAGLKLEEPEYEVMAACSSVIGVHDVTSTMVLASKIDRLGIDANETGWLIGWLMECYEKGLLKKEDIDGLDMKWGNVEAVMVVLERICRREGFADILAEGVMRASYHVGGDAPKLGVYTLKGNTPRGHDHRVVAPEWFDTCVSNTGTIETHFQSAPYEELGLARTFDMYDPEVLPEVEAKIRGSMIFEDSVVSCRFQTNGLITLLCEAVNAVTDWDMTFHEAMKVGRRAVNLARSFNLLSGIEAKLDAPSPRYGSLIPDGPLAGKNANLLTNWGQMLKKYYKLMGWDEETSRPMPETLRELDLDFVVQRLWLQKTEDKGKNDVSKAKGGRNGREV